MGSICKLLGLGLIAATANIGLVTADPTRLERRGPGRPHDSAASMAGDLDRPYFGSSQFDEFLTPLHEPFHEQFEQEAKEKELKKKKHRELHDQNSVQPEPKNDIHPSRGLGMPYSDYKRYESNERAAHVLAGQWNWALRERNKYSRAGDQAGVLRWTRTMDDIHHRHGLAAQQVEADLEQLLHSTRPTVTLQHRSDAVSELIMDQRIQVRSYKDHDQRYFDGDEHHAPASLQTWAHSGLQTGYDAAQAVHGTIADTLFGTKPSKE